MTTTARRSDDVRAKRNRRTAIQQPSRKISKRKSRINRAMPPTIARNNNMARPRQPQASRKVTRRRYNVALTQAGAEVRLPAIPQLKIGWRVISALFAITLLWSIYTVWTAADFKIKQPQITGLERLNSLEVDQFLGLRNQSIFSIDPNEIAKSLEENYKSLSTINVTLGLPNKVIIELVEREPEILWTQAGISVWIDDQGMAFDAIEESLNVIRVEAFQAPPPKQQSENGQIQLLSKEMVAAILTLAEKAPEDTVIIFDPVHGLGWTDSRGWDVYFGPVPSDMELRLTMYQNTIDYLTERGTLPAIISLEYIHQPFFRLQN